MQRFGRGRAQADLNQRMKELYLELDRTAWWWYSETPREAAIREIASPEMVQALLQDFGSYGANVGESVGVVKDFWREVVAPGYNPKDRTRLEANRKKTTEMFEKRKIIVDSIVQRFVLE